MCLYAYEKEYTYIYIHIYNTFYRYTSVLQASAPKLACLLACLLAGLPACLLACLRRGREKIRNNTEQISK